MLNNETEIREIVNERMDCYTEREFDSDFETRVEKIDDVDKLIQQLSTIKPRAKRLVFEEDVTEGIFVSGDFTIIRDDRKGYYCYYGQLEELEPFAVTGLKTEAITACTDRATKLMWALGGVEA